MTSDPHSLPASPRRLSAMLDPAAERDLRSLLDGAVRTQAIYVAAKLGVADCLGLEPLEAAVLAVRLGVRAEPLRRVLRLLAAHGVLAEREDGRFALTRVGEYLQTAHPRSLRPSAIRAGEELWAAAGALLGAVRTGETPHEMLYGTPFFARLAAEGKEREFAARMSSTVAEVAAALAERACVASARTVVDVGGGDGAVLAALLAAHPTLRGVLLDRGPVIDAARARLERAGVLDRCALVAGDYFAAVPAGGDVYVLSWVLHDWDDAHATRLLRECRKAGGAGSTLLAVEALLPPFGAPAAPAPSDVTVDPFALDLQMLLLTGGRERSEEEYRRLLRDAGYALGAIDRVASPRGASVLEARADSAYE